MNHQHKLLATAILLAASAGAQAQIYKATLSGANEVPAVTTSGTGVAVVSLNPAADELRVRTTFSGLNGNVTAAHVHCCAAPGANAGVATQTPTFSGFPAGVTSGSYDASFNTALATTWNGAFVTANGGTPAGAEAALLNGLNAGNSYLNIHTSTSPGGEIRANLQRFSFVPAASGQATGLAYALDSLGAGTGTLNERLVSMAMMTTPQQAAALTGLMPLPATVAASTLTNGLYGGFDQISNRLGGLRGEGVHGLWVRYADRQNDYDLSNRSATAESDGWDAGAGLDHQLESGLLLGISVTLAEDSVDFSGAMAGTSGEFDGWRTTFYAEQRFGAAFVEGMFTLAQGDITHLRNLGGANGPAAGESDSDQWGLRLALGTDVALGANVSVTPQLRFDYSDLELGGYQETAPSGLGLTVHGQDFESMRLGLGGQLDWNVSEGISPFVRAFWNNEFESGDTFTRAQFAGSSLFEVTDAGPGSSGYTAGLGVNFFSSDSFGASLSYDVSDSDDFESDVFQGRLLWRY